MRLTSEEFISEKQFIEKKTNIEIKIMITVLSIEFIIYKSTSDYHII